MSKLDALCDAFLERDPQRVEELFGDYLWNTISIRDTAVSKERKENFYHGILLGLLAHRENWLSMSNAESGLGYSDILIEIPKGRTGIVIEIKYPEDGDLDQGCEEALEQIEEKNCVAKLKQDGEYSCAMKSHFRKSGNQMSGKWKSSHASLLA